MRKILFCLMLLALLLQAAPQAAAQSGESVGGIHILMTSVTGEPLEGAIFRLCRETKPEELTDRQVSKEILPVGQEYQIMTETCFWDNREQAGDRVTAVATDAEGKAAMYGLEYGTYYLIEESAPEGYNRIAKPIRLTIHKYSHLTQADGIYDDQDQIIDNTVHIVNIRYSLPKTGGLEHLRLIAGGIGVVFSAVSLLLLNRKRI